MCLLVLLSFCGCGVLLYLVRFSCSSDFVLWCGWLLLRIVCVGVVCHGYVFV